MFKEPKFSLWDLYHPGGFPLKASDTETCHCGCNPHSDGWRPTAEQLGIKNTPAMRTIAAEKKLVNARAPKIRQKSTAPWKGAKIDEGIVHLPDTLKRCTDSSCLEEHGEVVEVSKYGSRTVYRVHFTDFPANIYTLNGATAKVRLDMKGGKL